jgi:hypothetical protein
MAPRRQSLARDLVSLFVVLGLVSLGLRLLDLLPQRFAEPRGGRAFARIQDVERRLGERLALPAYFPQTLRWPPAQIRVAGARPAVVVLRIDAAEGGPRLFLAQSIGGREEPQGELWPGGVVLEETRVTLPQEGGRLSRILEPDGKIWHELRFERWERTLLLRSTLPPDELVTLARSLRKEGP